MALDLSEFDDDLAEIIADIPQMFTYAAVTYTGAFSTATETKEMQEAGFIPEIDAVLVCQLSIFTDTTPETNSLIVVAGDSYRVFQVIKDAFGKGIKFGLKRMA